MVVEAVSQEPVRTETIIAGENRTMISFSKNETTTAITNLAEEGAVLLGVDLHNMAKEETSHSTGTNKVRDSDLTEINPVGSEMGKTEDLRIVDRNSDEEEDTLEKAMVRVGVRRNMATVGTSRLRRTTKVRDSGLTEINPVGKETHRTEDVPNLVMEGGSSSMETNPQVDSGSRSTEIKTTVEISGATNHVVRTNITTKNRSKTWMTCSRRNRRS